VITERVYPIIAACTGVRPSDEVFDCEIEEFTVCGLDFPDGGAAQPALEDKHVNISAR
jgi:hypothetical protein